MALVVSFLYLRGTPRSVIGHESAAVLAAPLQDMSVQGNTFALSLCEFTIHFQWTSARQMVEVEQRREMFARAFREDTIVFF